MVLYWKAKMEKFAEYLNQDGLVSRLTVYMDTASQCCHELQFDIYLTLCCSLVPSYLVLLTRTLLPCVAHSYPLSLCCSLVPSHLVLLTRTLSPCVAHSYPLTLCCSLVPSHLVLLTRTHLPCVAHSYPLILIDCWKGRRRCR